MRKDCLCLVNVYEICESVYSQITSVDESMEFNARAGVRVKGMVCNKKKKKTIV